MALRTIPTTTPGVLGLQLFPESAAYVVAGGDVIPNDEIAIANAVNSLVSEVAILANSAQISVATTSALNTYGGGPAALVLSGLKDGTIAFVQSQDAYYSFNTATPGWDRFASSANNQPTWEVSSITGTADGTGLPGSPVTLAELRARLYRGDRAPISIPTVITIIDSTFADDLVFYATILTGGNLVIQGSMGVVSTNAFTAFAARAPATNTPNLGTQVTENWAANVGHLIIDTQAGPNLGASAWVVADTGGGVGRLSSFMLFDPALSLIAPTEVTPAGTDSYTINQVTNCTGQIDIDVDGEYFFAIGSGKAVVNNFQLTGVGGFGTGAVTFHGVAGYITNCAFNAPFAINCNGVFGYINCIQLFTAAIGYGVVNEPLGGGQNIFGGAALDQVLVIGCLQLFLRDGFLIQYVAGSSPLLLSFGSGVFLQDVGAFDAISGAVVLGSENSVVSFFAAAALWGSSAIAGSYAFEAAESEILNEAGTTWALAVPIAPASTQLVLDTSITGMPISATTWLDVAPAQNLTIALLDTATGAGGFGGKVLNKRGGSTFNRTGVA